MGYQNVRLGKAELFDPFRVAGQLRVARKKPKKHVIFGIFWPKLDNFGKFRHIAKDRKPKNGQTCQNYYSNYYQKLAPKPLDPKVPKRDQK